MIANNLKNSKNLSEDDYLSFSPLFNELLSEHVPFSNPSANEEINPLRIRQLDTEQDYYLNAEDSINSSSSYQIPRVYYSKSDANKPIMSEAFEIEKLKNLLRYPVFQKEDQIKIWKRYRKFIKRNIPNLWVYYFEIENSIFIFFVDETPRFDLVFKSVESEFPKLYSKYYLKVKEISNKPIKTF